MSTRIGLISDTHGLLRPDVFDAFRDVDRILHAGDVGGQDILVELATIAPVQAVFGNTDDWALRSSLAAERSLDIEGRRIVLVHGDALGSPTPARLRAAWPDADIIVYGHTHVQMIDREGALTINPGAAGPARFRLTPSVAILTLGDGVEDVESIELVG